MFLTCNTYTWRPRVLYVTRNTWRNDLAEMDHAIHIIYKEGTQYIKP